MYRIIKDSEIIALCDDLRFVRKKESTGCYIRCSEDEADGIAIKGELYNLPGKNKIVDKPEVFIEKIDGGDFLFSDYVDKRVFSSEISALEDALCEIDQGEE